MTLAGIYRITNKLDNKVYFGQSVNLKKRLKDHHRELTKFRHHNNYLQNAVNKYNLDNFTFEIIETIEPFDRKDPQCIELLNYLENFYIDSYESLASQNGYNIRNGGNSTSGYYLANVTKYVFYDPENNIVEVDNLSKFCNINNLEISGMRRVSYGEVTHYKQWTKYPKTNTFKYKLKSPDNIIFEFNDLKEFTNTHSLSSQLLSHVINGRRKHHQSWTLPGVDVTPLYKSCPINKHIKYNWINLKTKEEIKCTVLDLSKKYNLPTCSLYKLASPTERDITCQNWTIYNIRDIKVNREVKSKPIYKFIHKNYGIIECTTQELLKTYPELVYSKVNAIIAGSRKHHKGWQVLKEEKDSKRDLVESN